jgi:N-acetylmuramoyl-L-alanine amidase
LKILTRSRRLGYAAAVLLLAAAPASARRHKPESWARQQCATADRLREALNGRPAADRSRREYQRVIDAYRRVYYGSPAASKADPSVVAVAELLVEMGRQFDDPKVLRSAIGQYEFLRREYPGSRFRFDALFTIGEIYKDDLANPSKAHEAFQEFVRRYPHNRLAAQAREALAEPIQQASLKKAAPARDLKNDLNDEDKDQSEGKDRDREKDKDKGKSDASAAMPPTKPDSKQPLKLARVTGIRHWSTPDYTRVAIDLEQDVKFDSQRIDHPDRIFFDLRGTVLASTLVGKSFDGDNGFLKKIRVAQFKEDQARVVLEVDSLSQYDAFLLPNPYRLIIDIHGKPTGPRGSGATAVADAKQDAEPTASDPETQGKAETKGTGRSDKAEKAVAAKEDQNDEDDVAADPPAKSMAKDAVAKHTVVKNNIAKDTVRKIAGGSVKEPAPKVSPPDGAADDASNDEGSPGSVHDKKSSKSKRSKKVEDEIEAREAQPSANGDRSLIRALGLKIGKIVIDPGHGGHDTGTIGPNGVREKDVVLDVSRRLGKMLRQQLGAQVIYTRSDDTFIPLETRTAIANRERADLFISVHANSSEDPDARGVETYYLNFTSSKDALEVAARENAVSQKSIYELQDLVKKIALKEKIDESREFASDVQSSLYTSLASKSSSLRNRGVKKAPFIVLIGANMPSILAEISFVSNPVDARRLQTPEHRQQIAESLYRGVARYVNGLSGIKVASRTSRDERN